MLSHTFSSSNPVGSKCLLHAFPWRTGAHAFLSKAGFQGFPTEFNAELEPAELMHQPPGVDLCRIAMTHEIVAMPYPVHPDSIQRSYNTFLSFSMAARNLLSAGSASKRTQSTLNRVSACSTTARTCNQFVCLKCGRAKHRQINIRALTGITTGRESRTGTALQQKAMSTVAAEIGNPLFS